MDIFSKKSNEVRERSEVMLSNTKNSTVEVQPGRLVLTQGFNQTII